MTRNGADGALVAPGNAQLLAVELESVLSNGTRRDQLVESGSNRVQEFSMHRLADLYLDAYGRAAEI